MTTIDQLKKEVIILKEDDIKHKDEIKKMETEKTQQKLKSINSNDKLKNNNCDNLKLYVNI